MSYLSEDDSHGFAFCLKHTNVTGIRKAESKLFKCLDVVSTFEWFQYNINAA